METNTMTRFQYDDSSSRRRSRRKLKSCNPQICFSYLLSVMASILIVGGVYLSYIRWDQMWLILALLGILLILIGSCFYYSGNANLYHTYDEHIYENRPTRRRRYRNRGLSADQLMPSAPPFSQSRSVSQLSLNMIPQYFSSNESEAIPTNTTTTPPVSPLKTFSQIFSVNGQSYLILPLTGEPLPASDSFSLQNIVVKVTEDNKAQSSNIIKTNNQTSAETESKKISREEQSCQTDDYPKEISKTRNMYRDVQLQTLERISIEVANTQTESSLSSRRTESTNVPNDDHFDCDSLEICPNAGPSHMQSCESQPYSIQSYESCTSANTECEHLNLDPELPNSISLIDFDEDRVGCTSNLNHTIVNNYDIQTEQNCSLIEVQVESDCFNSFLNENTNEDEIDDTLSTPPPSYEEVVDETDDDNSDETSIVVNYGTL